MDTAKAQLEEMMVAGEVEVEAAVEDGVVVEEEGLYRRSA